MGVAIAEQNGRPLAQTRLDSTWSRAAASSLGKALAVKVQRADTSSGQGAHGSGDARTQQVAGHAQKRPAATRCIAWPAYIGSCWLAGARIQEAGGLKSHGDRTAPSLSIGLGSSSVKL